ncbi:DUF3300 domain-containing protein [Neptunicella marina]|uniref:DUF3300 domain-containing protein n=1 Tax=Neptunicella marina TaxID=2125989 RepID=A0A8J6M3F6_9ALTE|nr:DUF3300 domain-containing protein [Neptunicella marina]MBC3767423.1 DUF3300 domain-containing protein [Neptunicella marina]
MKNNPFLPRLLLTPLCSAVLLVAGFNQYALAQTTPETSQQTQRADDTEQVEAEPLDQARIDQLLAPIALYPDTLLSHILVASTYPLEVVQLARWRQQHKDLDAQAALDAVENKDWDPSVQALAPFSDLIERLNDDLEWLDELGNAFLANEQQVLSTVQNLRLRAYNNGTLQSNQQLQVDKDKDEIVIQPVQKEVVYVPYYDTRVVYGNWWWDDYPPFYWHYPSHYVRSGWFYYSPGWVITSGFYFGGFHWHQHRLVVNYQHRRHYTPVDTRKRVRVNEYQRWQHDKHHRHNVRYQHSRSVSGPAQIRTRVKQASPVRVSDSHVRIKSDRYTDKNRVKAVEHQSLKQAGVQNRAQQKRTEQKSLNESKQLQQKLREQRHVHQRLQDDRELIRQVRSDAGQRNNQPVYRHKPVERSQLDKTRTPVYQPKRDTRVKSYEPQIESKPSVTVRSRKPDYSSSRSRDTVRQRDSSRERNNRPERRTKETHRLN